MGLVRVRVRVRIIDRLKTKDLDLLCDPPLVVCRSVSPGPVVNFMYPFVTLGINSSKLF